MRSVVTLLVIANVAVYALDSMLGGTLYLRFALWPWGHFYAPEFGMDVGFAPWQLLTSAFLHDTKNLMHIGFNMLALYMFGNEVERALGSRRFLWLYFASVLTASLVQLIVVTANAPEVVAPTVGASGGVFGVLLAFAMLYPHRRVMLIFPPIPMPAWLLVAGYGVVELANGVFGTQQGVAHFAHLGGMLGALIVLLVARRAPPRYRDDA
jgi:membrane associated rhomboid family serine protease